MEEKGLPIGVIVIVIILAAIAYGNTNSTDSTETDEITNSNNEIVSEETSSTSTNEVGLDISENIATNKITMPTSAYDYKYENYQDIINDLHRLGFTNVKTDVVYDIYFGILVSEGESDKVTIDRNSDFKQGDTFSKDAEIIVTVHLSYTDDPNYEGTNTSAETTKSPTATTTESKSLYYSTNDKETAKDGNAGVYSYKNRGGEYNIYYIIDFDEGYVYRFIEGNGDETCDRLKIDSGDLNNGIIITYHDGDDTWSNGLRFKWQKQPDNLILEDSYHFETEFDCTNLNDALRLRDKKKIIDY